jgi:sialate O-acetylesterase
MKHPFLLSSIVYLLLLACFECIAQITPAKIFSDNMMLQRGIKIPVWGKAMPGELITIAFDKKIASVTTNLLGQWKVVLPEFKAGGPFNLKITGNSDSIIFKNVLIGDVWFASGQSNMEHPVKGWEWIPHSEIENYEEELQGIRYPEIRLFEVPKYPSPVELDDLTGGEWQTASPESVAGFSSIGWFFAKKLNKDLNIPIGIIHSSWGGTAIKTWLDRESLEVFKDSINLPAIPQNFDQTEWKEIAVSSIEKHRIRRNQISYPEKGLKEIITGFGYNDSNWQQVNFPNENNNFENVVWFRKIITIPKDNVNETLHLSLGFLNRQSQIFLNEIELGYFQYPKPVNIKIPDKILRPGENVLTIRIAQPFGGAQIFGDKESFYISNSKGSFYLNIADEWKANASLELVHEVEVSFQNNPAYLYNGMVAPIIPYGIKGFIWYQGESDTGRPFLYEKLFSQLITGWRQRWDLGSLPFVFIQTSNIELSHHFEKNDDSWCLLREAQKKALLLPNTGMVVSIDIGDPYDVHPKNKKEFARRLALQAEEKVYGKNVISDGPVAQSYTIEGNTIIVQFNTKGKLKANTKDILNQFEMEGVDGNYYPAIGDIKGNKIFITSAYVKTPLSARYAWKNNPKFILFNKDKLPASQFDTRNLVFY